MTIRLHIDTDGGVDDAIALTAIARSGVRIESVSAVFGNTWVDQAASNARWVLGLSHCGPEVYVGAARGLADRAVVRHRPGHGEDGMNGAGGSRRRRLPPLERPHGVSVIAQAARNGVTGLFLGPLTNLARALLEDPRAMRGWSPVAMAGAFEVQGQGQGGVDFNTWSDPEALRRVLLAGVMPRLVTLDATSQVRLRLEAFEAASVQTSSPLFQKLYQAAGPYAEHHARTWGGEGCRPHDAVAAGAVLWPELYEFTAAFIVPDPEHPGRLSRTEGAPNALVCVNLDAAEVEKRLLAALFG